ncbi:MMPL family transporter [Streptomyces lavendulocolor]|uniref:MMPL family transporter n=1 Tax=Streptomyces lavendulocolor TaxID=67316 RepID=UPI003C2AF501
MPTTTKPSPAPNPAPEPSPPPGRGDGPDGPPAPFAVRHRHLVSVVALLLMALSGLIGRDVADRLSSGGIVPPGAESMRAEEVLRDRFGAGRPEMVLLVRTDAVGGPGGRGIGAPAAVAAGRAVERRLAADPGVERVLSTWSAGPGTGLRSRDGRSGLVLAWLRGGDHERGKTAERVVPGVTGRFGPLEVTAGGEAPTRVEVARQASRDARLSELVALPVTVTLLLLVFGSLPAAGLPVLVGVFAALGTTALLRGLTGLTEVSVYALNIGTALAFALAIDYSLFLVSRYREERARGAEDSAALRTALRTAGRAVAFSAGTVACSMAALLVFPHPLLRSLGFAGVAVTVMAAVGSLVVLPAVLALLGDRLDRLDVFARWRRPRAAAARSTEAAGCPDAAEGRPEADGSATGAAPGEASGTARAGASDAADGTGRAGATGAAGGTDRTGGSGASGATSGTGRTGGTGATDGTGRTEASGAPRGTGVAGSAAAGRGGWGRIALAVMRRPLATGVPVACLLVLLTVPFADVRFAMSDDRVLPASSAAGGVGAALREDFPGSPVGATTIALPGLDTRVPARAAELDRYARRVSAVDGVTRVDTATGTYARGRLVTGPSPSSARFLPRRSGPGGTYLSVAMAGEPGGPAGADRVGAIRAVPAPAPARVGGFDARVADVRGAIGDRLPLALTLVGVSMVVLVLGLTRRPVLALKALVLNTLSLCATFGALVFVFQQGHLKWLVGDFVTTGSLDVQIPVVTFCVAFGLSMDYECMLLSRMVEEHRAGADTVTAVARGLDRTARLFTWSAAILAVVMVALATSGLVFLKAVGVGLALAAVLDATVVRGLLVPAVMRLAGRANWWAPAWLRGKEDHTGPLVR